MELESLWQLVLSDLELQISRPNFVTWLKFSRLVNYEDGVAFVALPNTFTKEWVQSKYQKMILGSLRQHQELIKSTQFLVQSTNIPIIKKTIEPKATSQFVAQMGFDEFRVDADTNLNPRYTLNSFIVGRANELAHAAAMAVIDTIGTKYNPFFIYGGVGVGKTHLLQATGNAIKEKYQGRVKVRYVSSERFTNDVVAAMRNKRMDDIKEKYRTVDVLIIDDIQFIGGKVRTEEEFFHTFNALYEQNKQIIISSDRPPRHIPTLEERLRSRFQGGMITDVGYPDYELRLAVIKTKLQERQTSLPEPVLEFIATKVQKNFREIEGILNRLLFYQHSTKQEVSLRLVEQIVRETIQQPSRNSSPEEVIKIVADHFQIPIADIVGKSRKKELIEPRQVAIYLLRELLDLSYPCIGDKLGNRDHTTAIYAYTKISRELTKNPELSQRILTLRDIIVREG